MEMHILLDSLLVFFLGGSMYYMYHLNQRLDRHEKNRQSLTNLVDELHESWVKIQKSQVSFEEKTEANLADLKGKITLGQELKGDLQMLCERSDQKGDELELRLRNLARIMSKLALLQQKITPFQSSSSLGREPLPQNDQSFIQKMKKVQ